MEAQESNQPSHHHHAPLPAKEVAHHPLQGSVPSIARDACGIFCEVRMIDLPKQIPLPQDSETLVIEGGRISEGIKRPRDKRYLIVHQAEVHVPAGEQSWHIGKGWDRAIYAECEFSGDGKQAKGAETYRCSFITQGDALREPRISILDEVTAEQLPKVTGREVHADGLQWYGRTEKSIVRGLKARGAAQLLFLGTDGTGAHGEITIANYDGMIDLSNRPDLNSCYQVQGAVEKLKIVKSKFLGRPFLVGPNFRGHMILRDCVFEKLVIDPAVPRACYTLDDCTDAQGLAVGA